MNSVSIWVSGDPVGKGRPRFSTRNGFATAYTPKKTSDYEKRIATEYIRSENYMMFSGAVMVEINAYFVIPESTTKKRRRQIIDTEERPTKKPDIDNLVKICLDGLNGVAFGDDKQVIELIVNKYYSHDDNPGVEITVSDWGE